MHLNHKHVLFTATLRNPPQTTEILDEWLRRLVKNVDMQILFGPYLTRCDTEGNEGVTGIVCIETSHSSIHVWDKTEVPFLKFDLYSCKDFETETVIDMLKEFDPYWYQYMLIDRNDKFKILDHEENQLISAKDMLSSEEKNILEDTTHINNKKVTKTYKKYKKLYELKKSSKLKICKK